MTPTWLTIVLICVAVSILSLIREELLIVQPLLAIVATYLCHDPLMVGFIAGMSLASVIAKSFAESMHLRELVKDVASYLWIPIIVTALPMVIAYRIAGNKPYAVLVWVSILVLTLLTIRSRWIAEDLPLVLRGSSYAILATCLAMSLAEGRYVLSATVLIPMIGSLIVRKKRLGLIRSLIAEVSMLALCLGVSLLA